MPEDGRNGRLILVGAPLGNPADASTRMRDALAESDVVAAEDTRRLIRLARDLGITVAGRIVSYFEGNEERRTPELVETLRDGAVVALVTDGGMPSVSDPGYRLVRAALDAGLPVTVAPGPSAVTTALAVSGLPTDRFCFEGFLPRTGGARRARLAALAAEERTLVFFEAPHRTLETLAAMAVAFGADRRAAVCRELTKTHEEVRRGPLAELVAWAEEGVRGEVTLVVAGAPPVATDLADAVRAVRELTATGIRMRPAVAEVALRLGIAKNKLYELVLKDDSGQ